MKKYLTALLVLGILMVLNNVQGSPKVVNAMESTYVVKQGDTLYSISKQYDISLAELKNSNEITHSTIRVGQNLSIPVGQSKNHYIVQHGDTLYSISKLNGVAVNRIKELNNLKDNLIVVGQKIVLGQSEVITVFSTVQNPVFAATGFSEAEIQLLARMIYAEARGESYAGKVGVGAVILNRIESPDFPNTMREVIYQKTRKGYQFSPVQDGSINLKPDKISLQAAYAAIRGEDPTGGSLYFYNPDLATDKWITTLPVSTKIGNHLFAR